jgi:hypothetical protein
VEKSESAQLVMMLMAAFPHTKATPATSAVYEESLADLDFAVARKAVARLLKTVKFLPTIAEIREECKLLTPPKPLLRYPPIERVSYEQIQKLLSGMTRPIPAPETPARRMTAAEIDAAMNREKAGSK